MLASLALLRLGMSARCTDPSSVSVPGRSGLGSGHDPPRRSEADPECEHEDKPDTRYTVDLGPQAGAAVVATGTNTGGPQADDAPHPPARPQVWLVHCCSKCATYSRFTVSAVAISAPIRPDSIRIRCRFRALPQERQGDRALPRPLRRSRALPAARARRVAHGNPALDVLKGDVAGVGRLSPCRLDPTRCDVGASD